MESNWIMLGAIGVGALAGYIYGTQDGEKRFRGKPVLHEKVDTPSTQIAFIVRKDLGMSKGKAAAQVSHAALACYELVAKRAPMLANQWRKEGQQKAVLAVNSQAELLDLQQRAQAAGVICQIIQDAGRTEIEPGSITVLGIGPAPLKQIEKLTLHLNLY